MKDLISVIVPIYNVERYLNRCIDSIINQTYSNIEIILVDDGSPDNCGKICDEYSLQDNRIKVIHKSNGGVSSARNSGLMVSEGEYYMFVDPDDYISVTLIQDLYDALITYNANLIISNCIDIDENRKEIPSDFDLLPCVVSLDKRKAIEHLAGHNLFVEGVLAKLFDKSISNNLKFNTFMDIAEDEDYLFEYLKGCERVTVIPQKGYYYYHRAGSAMHNIVFKNFNGWLGLYEKIYNEFNDKSIRSCVCRKQLKTYTTILFCVNLNNEDYLLIRKEFKQFLKNQYLKMTFKERILSKLLLNKYARKLLIKRYDRKIKSVKCGDGHE